MNEWRNFYALIPYFSDNRHIHYYFLTVDQVDVFNQFEHSVIIKENNVISQNCNITSTRYRKPYYPK